MNENEYPNSKLTLLRPDIWERALLLSTKLTAYQYVPKVPNEQTGTIYACGYGGSYYPSYQERISNIRDEINRYEEMFERINIQKEKGHKPSYDEHEIVTEIQKRKRRIGELEKEEAQSKIEKDKRWIERDKASIEHHEVEEEIHRRRGNTTEEKRHRSIINEHKNQIKEREKRIKENEKKLLGKLLVPEGAMEWLLHEVGHWVAASQEERNLPNYGFGIIREGVCTCTKNFTECRCGDEREWQAWAFEEIILAPFGNSRLFCPPPHRGGIAFDKNQSIPGEALRHIENRLRAVSINVEEWRTVWGEWVQWGRSLGSKAPWEGQSCM